MEFGPKLKAAIVLNSLVLVGLLISYRTGYLHMPFRAEKPVAGSKPDAPVLAPPADVVMLPGSKSYSAITHVDAGELMLSSKSGLVAPEGGTVLGLDVDDQTTNGTTQPSQLPTTQSSK